MDPFSHHRPSEHVRVHPDDVPKFPPCVPYNKAGGDRRRLNMETNRPLLLPLLHPEDYTRSGVIRWRSLSNRTGIPRTLLKRWWWGEASMSNERAQTMLLHKLSIGR